MADYSAIKAVIRQIVKENHNGEIDGQLLQGVLLNMVSSLSVGFQFMGVATPSTNPGTPDQNVFYLAAENGTYSNFGGLTVEDELAIFTYDGNPWEKDSVPLGGGSFPPGIYAGTGQNALKFNDENNIASGNKSTAQGTGTRATGNASHAEGRYTQTTNNGEHAEGVYNKSNSGEDGSEQTVHSVGIGMGNSSRKNAEEIMFSGDKYLYLLGGYDGTNPGAKDPLLFGGQAYSIRELSILLSTPPRMEKRIYYNADHLGPDLLNDRRSQYSFTHPLLSLPGAELVLMSYSTNNRKTSYPEYIQAGCRRRVKKGWCVCRDSANGYYKIDPTTSLGTFGGMRFAVINWLDIYSLINNLYTFRYRHTPVDRRKPRGKFFGQRTFGWSIRIPNPLYDGPTTNQRNAPGESLFTVPLVIKFSYDDENTLVAGMGIK